MAIIPGIGFVCTSDDMHPYECQKGCIHCSQTETETHKPKRCWLCCDGDPDADKILKDDQTLAYLS